MLSWFPPRPKRMQIFKVLPMLVWSTIILISLSTSFLVAKVRERSIIDALRMKSKKSLCVHMKTAINSLVVRVVKTFISR